MISDPVTGDPFRVVDVHQHLTLGEGTGPGQPLEPRLEVMDRFGIDQAILLPPSGAFGGARPSAAAVNEQAAAVVAASAGRFPCGVAHVDLGDGPLECARVIDHAVGVLGLRGVAWHHRFQGEYLDHPAMPGLLRQCARLGVPALVHVIAGSGLESLWRLDSLLRACPEATVCALDAFSSTEQAAEATELAARHPNLSCDLGAMISVSGWTIRKFLDTAGPDRLLFGTDLYMTPRTWYFPGPLHEVLHMDIPAPAKRQILAGNALSLFGLGDAPSGS